MVGTGERALVFVNVCSKLRKPDNLRLFLFSRVSGSTLGRDPIVADGGTSEDASDVISAAGLPIPCRSAPVLSVSTTSK
jgi:hypothetical protein